MRKKLYILGIVGFLSISFISIFEIKRNLNFVDATDECQHSGFHYEELLPDIDVAGHKEFWTCCKCHEAFLERPENGVFADQEDDLMIGEVDEEHIAYVAPIELKSLIYNERRYYPVIHSGDNLEGVTFYDECKNEIEPGINGYEMTNLGKALYYSLSEPIIFPAISCIENVSYNDIYAESMPRGIGAVSEAFKEKNNISTSERIEQLTISGEPKISDPPIIANVALSEIWNAYNSYGFHTSGFGFWSCVSYDETNAYYWDVDSAGWLLSIRALKNPAICVSTIFN